MVGDLGFELDRSFQMRDGFRISLPPDETLTEPRVSLPCIWIFRKCVEPKCLFILEKLSLSPCWCCRRRKHENDSCIDNPSNDGSALRDRNHGRAEESNQRKIGKVLKMIGDQRAAADVSHSQKSQGGQQRQNETSDREKQIARIRYHGFPLFWHEDHRYPDVSAGSRVKTKLRFFGWKYYEYAFEKEPRGSRLKWRASLLSYFYFILHTFLLSSFHFLLFHFLSFILHLYFIYNLVYI